MNQKKTKQMVGSDGVQQQQDVPRLPAGEVSSHFFRAAFGRVGFFSGRCRVGHHQVVFFLAPLQHEDRGPKKRLVKSDRA